MGHIQRPQEESNLLTSDLQSDAPPRSFRFHGHKIQLRDCVWDLNPCLRLQRRHPRPLDEHNLKRAAKLAATFLFTKLADLMNISPQKELNLRHDLTKIGCFRNTLRTI